MNKPFALADGVLGPLKAAREASVLQVYDPSQAAVVPGRRFEKAVTNSSSLAPGESAGVLPPVDQNPVPAEIMRRVTPRAPSAPSSRQTPVPRARPVPAQHASACNTEASAAMDRCFTLPSDFSSLRDFNRIVSRTLARPQPQQMDFMGYGGGVSGTGDVLGPDTSTDNAIARYDGTTGKRIQNSDVIIDDSDPTGTTVHTNEAGPDAPNPLIVRPGNTAIPGESGKALTLKGGSNNDKGVPAGDVEMLAGANLAGGPNGQVKIVEQTCVGTRIEGVSGKNLAARYTQKRGAARFGGIHQQGFATQRSVTGIADCGVLCTVKKVEIIGSDGQSGPGERRCLGHRQRGKNEERQQAQNEARSSFFHRKTSF